MNILVIGESCSDIFHYGVCDRLCPEAPVPVFNSIRTVENAGMAMNVYRNLMSLGANVDVVTNASWKTISKTRFVDIRTNHMFMRLDQNDDKYGVFDSTGIDFEKYDAVIVSDYNKGFLSQEDLKFISSKCRLTFLDTKKRLSSWSMGFSFVKINNKEFESTKDTITKDMMNNIVITRGPKGCEFNGKMYNVDMVEVKDTSGAGDTFVASLCFKYCLTKDIDVAISFANECSTKVVQKMGVATL